MLLVDEYYKSMILDSVSTPLPIDYYWVLDLSIKDFTLTPLLILEEIISKTHTIEINGFAFKLPSPWHILVYDEDTMEIDMACVGENLAGNNFTAMVTGPKTSNVKPGKIRVVDYSPEDISYAPSLGKHQMLCHPISPNEWINVSPSDIYNRYIKNCIVGDLL
jgi:hypothetical protein